MTPVLINPDGTGGEIQPGDGSHLTEAQEMEALGHPVQVLGLHDGRYMLINEHAAFDDASPVNHAATAIARSRGIHADDHIFGPAILCDECPPL